MRSMIFEPKNPQTHGIFLCTVAQISIDKDQDPKDYFRKLLNIKLGYLRKYCVGKKVLDMRLVGAGRLFGWK